MNDKNREITQSTPAELNLACKLAFDKRFFSIQARYDSKAIPPFSKS